MLQARGQSDGWRRAHAPSSAIRAAGDGRTDLVTVEGNAAGDTVRQRAEPLYLAGAAGVLIHIYVTPIKGFLQPPWVAGVVGSVGTYDLVAAPLDEGLVQYVLKHPDPHWPRLQGRGPENWKLAS